MDTTKNNAPGLMAHGAKENVRPNSDAQAARRQCAKTVETLKARAALLGLVLQPLDEPDGSTAYLIARNGMSKDLPSLDAVADFLRRWEGKP